MKSVNPISLLIRSLATWFATIRLSTGFVVSGNSMLPTLAPGDRVHVVPVRHKILPGEIVVFSADGLYKRLDSPSACRPVEVGGRLIKRVYASEGSPIPFIDDVQIIPPGMFYVVGDNLEESIDSRTFGLIDLGRIIGLASNV
ncbi:S26 family signal peptidase [Arthrobacter sp. AZCC_0090]|uniref:S26 family signal peptidase n=1 Tax=Arthrobacter sp. AZCC_0090 TaxID=2735881 RepID=UPI00160BF61C|nr:S26 family signal peptidase [Arthrobacter sp. AZCC_0090]MBB6405675.1 signal peptidase I [Arthrobacter sp. AZCC_0090]